MLERGEETTVGEGGQAVTIRHKYDGCWELYRDIDGQAGADIIHVCDYEQWCLMILGMQEAIRG